MTRTWKKAVGNSSGTSPDGSLYTFDFKKTLQKLSETIKSLAQEQTVVLVVDELDRCLPEYTIKVLERLHHIFDSIPNVQVVLAVDKRQLENTIKGIYGEEVSVRRYLAKFIDFELKLSVGEVSDEVKKVYGKYFGNFTYDISQDLDVDDACTTILKGIDIRTCKAILEKSFLAHRLLNSAEEKCDAAILCIEIFLTLLKEYGLNVVFAKNNFNIRNLFTFETATQDRLFSSTSQVLTGLAVLSDKYKPIEGESMYLYQEGIKNRAYIRDDDIWGLLLGCYRMILGFKGDSWKGSLHRAITVGNISLQEYVLKYWQFIKVLN